MSIATPALTNFTAGEVSPRLTGRVDISKYFNACSQVENFLVHPHGGATRRSGFRYIADAADHAGRSTLVPFEFNAEQSYVLEFGEKNGAGVVRVFKDGGQVLDDTGQPVEVVTPYLRADITRLKYVQSNDTLILVHPQFAPRSLTRMDHDDWDLTIIEFNDAPENWQEGNWPSVACFFEDRLALAATPDRPNTIWLSRTGHYFDLRMNTREVPLSKWGEALVKSPNDGVRDGKSGCTFLLLDGDSFETENAVKGTNAAGEKRYYRYKGDRVLLASLKDLSVPFMDSPGTDQIESVHDSAGNLRTAYWDEYSIGDRIPTTDGGEPLADDAIEVTLSASQANGIEFMVAKSRLWIGTIGGEWTLGGASSSEPITPASAKANQEGGTGSSKAMPVSVGFGSLFIQRAGRKVREMAYRFDSDAFASKDLTILAEHITAPSVTQLAYAQEPDSIVYAVRSDGVLLAMTYQKDQDVLAWARLSTQGQVESIACIFDHTDSADQLWAVVRREVNGQERRFVELLQPTFESGTTPEAFFLDCGLSYQGEPVETLTGLDHLAGEEVTVLADGLVLNQIEVSSEGEIALPKASFIVHAGLPYMSLISPMALEGGSSRGTAQTKIKRILEVAVRFHNTLGGKIGSDRDNLEPVMFLTSSAALGKALDLWTGDKRVKFPKGWGEEGTLCIVQDQPLPMTVLLIVPEVVVNT